MSKFTELTWSVKFDYQRSLRQMVQDLDALGKEHTIKVGVDVDLKQIAEIKKAGESVKNFTKKAKDQDSVLKALREELKSYKESLAVLHDESRRTGGATEENVRQQRELGESINRVGAEIRQVNRGFTEGQDVLKEDATTIADLKAQYAALMAERERVPMDSERFKELGKRANEVNKQLKTLDATVGVHSRNVGDYTNSIRGAANALAVFQGPLGPVAGRVNAFATTMGRFMKETDDTNKSMTLFGRIITGNIPYIDRSRDATLAKAAGVRVVNGAVRGLNVTLGALRVALIALGIPALIIAIAGLFQAYRRTEAGAQRLRVATAGLAEVWNVILDLVADVGEAIFKAFDDPKQAVEDLWEAIKQNVINRFDAIIPMVTSLGEVMMNTFTAAALAVKGIWDKEAREEAKEYWEEAKESARDYANAAIQLTTGIEDGFDRIVKGASDFGKKLKHAQNEGEALQERMNDVLVTERELSVLRAKQNRDLQETRDLVRDFNVHPRERLKLLDDIEEAEDALFKKEIANEMERLAVIQERMALSKDDEKDLQAEADQRIKIANLERAFHERSMSRMRDRTTLVRQMNDMELRNVRRVLDARIRADERSLEERRTILDREGGMVEAALLQQQMFEKRFDDELQLRKQAYRQELINQNIDDVHQLKLAEQRAEDEMASERLRIDNEVFDARKQRAQAQRDFEFQLERMHRDRMLAQELFVLEQRNDVIGQIRAEQHDMEVRQARERDERLAQLEQEFNDRGIRGKQAALNAQQQLDEEYAAEREEIERRLTAAIRQNQMDLMDAIVNLNSAGLKAIFGDNKAAAAADTITETIAGATRAFMANPPPSPLGAINAAATVAVGAANLRRILQTKIGDKSVSESGSSSTPPQQSFGLVDVGTIQTNFGEQMAFSASPSSHEQQLPPIIIEGDLDPAYLALKVTQGRNQISSDATGY